MTLKSEQRNNTAAPPGVGLKTANEVQFHFVMAELLLMVVQPAI